jgi:hypothetical protein
MARHLEPYRQPVIVLKGILNEYINGTLPKSKADQLVTVGGQLPILSPQAELECISEFDGGVLVCSEMREIIYAEPSKMRLEYLVPSLGALNTSYKNLRQSRGSS